MFVKVLRFGEKAYSKKRAVYDLFKKYVVLYFLQACHRIIFKKVQSPPRSAWRSTEGGFAICLATWPAARGNLFYGGAPTQRAQKGAY